MPRGIKEGERPFSLEVWRRDSEWILHGLFKGLWRNLGWSVLKTSEGGLKYGMAAYAMVAVEGFVKPAMQFDVVLPRDWVGLEFTEMSDLYGVLKAYTVVKQEQADLVEKWLEPFNISRDEGPATRLEVWLRNLSGILAAMERDVFRLDVEQVAGIKVVRPPRISVEGPADGLHLGYLRIIWVGGLTLDVKASIKLENPEKKNPFTLETAFGHIMAK